MIDTPFSATHVSSVNSGEQVDLSAMFWTSLCAELRYSPVPIPQSASLLRMMKEHTACVLHKNTYLSKGIGTYISADISNAGLDKKKKKMESVLRAGVTMLSWYY